MNTSVFVPAYGGAARSGTIRVSSGCYEGAAALSRHGRGANGDAELVARVLAGDTDAFAPIVARYQAAMLSSAMQMLGDAEAAHDCAQEAFIEAFRSLRNLRDAGSFRPWLFGILRNRCRKALSRNRFKFVALDDETDIPAQPVDESPAPDRARLVEIMRELPDSYREVLAARYLAEMDYEEIAAALGTSVNNIRVRCCRARERLREVLDRRGIRREGLLDDL